MIDVIFGRLGGGDNPTFWGVWGCGKWSGMPCLSGFLGGLGVFGGVREGFWGGGWALLGCWGMGLAGPSWAFLSLWGGGWGGVRGVRGVWC